MQQVHTAEIVQQVHTAVTRAASTRRADTSQRGARPVARATGRAEYQPVRVTRALKKGPRAASTRRADTSQRGARPVARATGRAEYQPVRATSALKKGPRAASTGRADTSRRSETSGASCRTSQKLAGPRDECSQKRISHQGRSPRGECAQKELSFGWRSVQAARRNSRTADCGGPRLRRSCLLRH